MSTEGRNGVIENYRRLVISANKEMTKKELFKDLLNRLYSSNPEIIRMLDEISTGSEVTIFNIPREDRMHRGSADTLYNKIIIEFENDLKQNLKHAKEQLAGYLLGQFNSGEGYNFTLIASDFINWKVYAPDVTQLDKLEVLRESELNLVESESAAFTLDENNGLEFYYWLDRFLFKEEKQKATLTRVEESFGNKSYVFIESFREMSKHLDDVRKFGEIRAAYEQWEKFLSIAYGSFDASEEHFLIHTYLSVFAKMLAYAVVSNHAFIRDEEMKGIIDGRIFKKYNIANFVETDFFYWVKEEPNYWKMKKVFRLIAQQISNFDFKDVDEDILKGVYQELIDLDTRQALGEYYTPDWLCERVCQEFDFKKTDRVLDPSCGSGSFLRAAVHRFRELHPKLSIEDLSEQIFGIDIHPLSVQITKTTMLISFGKDLIKLKQPIHLNIIQANTLLAPKGVKDLFGGSFEMNIDKEKIKLNTQIFDDIQLFDKALEACEDVAEQTQGGKAISLESFETIVKKYYENGGLTYQLTESFYKIYNGLKRVKEKGRDSIWKFILQNLYKPYFLAERFDYIVGNPPWFTFSSIKNEEYQDTLEKIAEKQLVKPDKTANMPHMEIAAIFLSYCSSYFLRENGKFAFVLPRSFFNADHHESTRSGKAKGFNLKQVWDLELVSPLFNVPSCVFLGSKHIPNIKNGAEGVQIRQFPKEGVMGKEFSGKVIKHNAKWASALKTLSENDCMYYYVRQGSSTALSKRRIKEQTKVNPYKKLFKQGATIVPRTFYFVELEQELPPDWDDRIINVRTLRAIKAEAKKPWKDLNFIGQIESRFVFRTALSRSILPFVLYKPDLVILPIFIEKNADTDLKEIQIKTGVEIMYEGCLKASRWYQLFVEKIWNTLRTEKNRKKSASDYLNWHSKLTSQNLNFPYLVIYTASAKDACATVVKREDFNLEFIVESKAYAYPTGNLYEAYYLVAILNSRKINLQIKDFQTRGLFGPRDIHKKILDVYFPRFNSRNKRHLKLAELGKSTSEKAKLYLEQHEPEQELSPLVLGKLRNDIRKFLENELDNIDILLNDIMT